MESCRFVVRRLPGVAIRGRYWARAQHLGRMREATCIGERQISTGSAQAQTPGQSRSPKFCDQSAAIGDPPSSRRTRLWADHPCHQIYPKGEIPEADLHPQKVGNLGPMAPTSS